MKLQVVIVLCVALVGISTAAEVVPTITVYAEPPELEIWVDGERIGVGEAVLFGPFDDYVEVTVKGRGYKEINQVVDPPTEEDEDVIFIITGEPRDFSVLSLLLGTLTTFTFVGAFVLMVSVFD